jgi:hypothetical protein
VTSRPYLKIVYSFAVGTYFLAYKIRKSRLMLCVGIIADFSETYAIHEYEVWAKFGMFSV